MAGSNIRVSRRVGVSSFNEEQARQGVAKLAKALPSMPIAELIAAHRAAVMADEVSFDDDGNAFDKARAGATGEAEKAAYERFILEPCRTDAEVQAKIAYVLEPAIAQRESNLTPLSGRDGENWDICEGPEILGAFLRSMVIKE